MNNMSSNKGAGKTNPQNYTALEVLFLRKHLPCRGGLCHIVDSSTQGDHVMNKSNNLSLHTFLNQRGRKKTFTSTTQSIQYDTLVVHNAHQKYQTNKPSPCGVCH